MRRGESDKFCLAWWGDGALGGGPVQRSLHRRRWQLSGTADGAARTKARGREMARHACSLLLLTQKVNRAAVAGDECTVVERGQTEKNSILWTGRTMEFVFRWEILKQVLNGGWGGGGDITRSALSSLAAVWKMEWCGGWGGQRGQT